MEQKQLIDLHTNIATALLENIKERKLDVLFETEEKLLNGQGDFKNLLKINFFLDISILECLKQFNNKDDILRLLLITLCSRNFNAVIFQIFI